jgi:hypothetical protein
MVIDAFAAVRGLQPQKMSTVAILLGIGIIRIYFETGNIFFIMYFSLPDSIPPRPLGEARVRKHCVMLLYGRVTKP